MATKSELYGGPQAPHNHDSLFAALEHGFLKNPEEVAVVSRSQRGDHLSEMVHSATNSQPSRIEDSCLRWNYAEYLATTLNIAAGLSTQAISADSLIVTFIPNSVEWLLLLSSSVIAKKGLACLDIDMLQKPRREELKAKLIQLRPSSIVVADSAGASAVDEVLQGIDLKPVLKVSLEASLPQSNGNMDSWRPFASLCEPRSASLLAKTTEDARHDDPDRAAMVIYTSGTSGGMPKGCVRHVGSMIAYVKQQKFARPGDVHHNVRIMQTANFRAIAPAISLMVWRDGSTMVLSTYPFHPKTFLADLEEERVTEVALIPAQVHAISEEPALKSTNLDSLRLVGSGGDMVTSALIAAINRCFPQASYMTIHGMTECGGVFQWPYRDGIDSIPFHQGISPLGHPSPGAKIRMVSRAGEVAARGEAAELHIQHASVFKTYLREQEGMPEFYTDETGQWFKTGDLGMINDAGDVYIVGRIKDVVKRSGVSIAPAAIESCLQTYLGSQVSNTRSHPTSKR
jgi:fatty-acyl-CoA synthase